LQEVDQNYPRKQNKSQFEVVIFHYSQ